MSESKFSRRQTLAAAAGAAAVGVGAFAATTRDGGIMTTQKTERMPVAFLPHGGGPWPFVDLGFGDKKGADDLRAYLESVKALPKTAPKALLVISAHWEEAVPTVMTSEKPPMLYDYYGFPPESYRITWPAPGSPTVAARVR